MNPLHQKTILKIKIYFKHIVCITPPSDSVIINLIDLYLHLKVICKFECPVRDTIESTEVSLNSTLLSKKNNSL